MKPKQAIVSLAMMMVGVTAHAQGSGREGHGGKVWVCDFPGEPTTYELNDFWRARDRWKNLEIDQGPGPMAEDHIEYVLKNLELVDPWRAKNLRERAKTFHDRASKEDISLSGINPDDTKEYSGREHCKPVTMVNQPHNIKRYSEDDLSDRDTRFWLYQKYWKGTPPGPYLPESVKAALIIHELVYEEALYYGHKDAEDTLFFTALIHSKNLKNYTRKQWAAKVLEANMPYWFQGGKFRMSAYWKPDGAEHIDIALPQSGMLLETAVVDGYPVAVESAVTFDIAGNIKSAAGVHMGKDGKGLISHDVSTPIGMVTVFGNTDFYPNGNIQESFVSSGKIRILGQEVGVVNQISFHENGMIKTAELECKTYRMIDGKPRGCLEFPAVSIAGENDVQIAAIGLREDGSVANVRLVKEQAFNTRAGRITLRGVVQFHRNGTLLSGAFVKPKTSWLTREAIDGFGGRVRLKDGERSRNVDNGYALYFDENGYFLSGTAILPIAGASDLYIRVLQKEDEVGFRLCSLSLSKECSVIGNREFYSKKSLKKKLKVNANYTYRGMSRTEFVLLWGVLSGIGIGTGVFPILVADAVFVPIFSGIATSGSANHASRTGERSVARRLLKKEDFQVVTSVELTSFAQSLEKVLKTIE